MMRYYCDERSILSFLFLNKSGGAGLFLYDTKPPRLVSPKSKRGVMTKTLHQIQQENRKFILEANYGTFEEALNNTNLSIYIKGNYNFLPLTLSRVLLAFKNKEVRTQFGYRLYFGIESSKFCSLRMHSRTAEKFMEAEFDWDLTIETLEEQSEETQRGINKLFNN